MDTGRLNRNFVSRILDDAMADFLKQDKARAALHIAQVYAFRGEADEAFQWLDRAYLQKDPGLVGMKGDALKELRARPEVSSFHDQDAPACLISITGWFSLKAPCCRSDILSSNAGQAMLSQHLSIADLDSPLGVFLIRANIS
jgi:hypothetical protein